MPSHHLRPIPHSRLILLQIPMGDDKQRTSVSEMIAQGGGSEPTCDSEPLGNKAYFESVGYEFAMRVDPDIATWSSSAARTGNMYPDRSDGLNDVACSETMTHRGRRAPLRRRPVTNTLTTTTTHTMSLAPGPPRRRAHNTQAGAVGVFWAPYYDSRGIWTSVSSSDQPKQTPTTKIVYPVVCKPHADGTASNVLLSRDPTADVETSHITREAGRARL
ncbi:hypothetical protein CTA1_4758 [Colletotrichum tanaceti]|uniref:Uncharacterized protein n=1 Tax=Colletotrichum tanaceti TaxID=1306861 RepID=A0A4U6XW91_9PEZI|nr:hypothetical protein CTA1_4758 [Colletotrichum tanaceti]